MGESADFFREMRERKKQRKENELNNPPKRRCRDWIIVNGNCHYAKNRSSFTSYRRISGTAMGAKVIGIGTVELVVLCVRGRPETRIVYCENTLHIPDAKCNGCNPLLHENMRMESSSSDHALTGYDKTGKPTWYSVPFCGYQKLVLADTRPGESPLQEHEATDGTLLRLSINVSLEEQRRIDSQIGDSIIGSKVVADEDEAVVIGMNRCWDWMIVSGNTHFAKDREAFKKYREIEKTERNGIVGVGTVELKVRRSDQNLDTYILVLKNVAHTPNALCNGLSMSKSEQHIDFGAVVQATDDKYKPMWYATDFCGLQRLALDIQPPRMSELEMEFRNRVRFATLSRYLTEEEKEAVFE